MLPRRSLFGLLAGAVAALAGWKAKPAPIVFHPDALSLAMAPLGLWPIKDLSREEFKRLYQSGEPTPFISPAWVRAHTAKRIREGK